MNIPEPISNVDEPNIRQWLRAKGWLWHESHVVTPECMDEIQEFITHQVAEAYKQGYNDNSRDCICDSVDYRGFTERVPHRHLIDDGDSHNIRPDVQLTNDKELEQ